MSLFDPNNVVRDAYAALPPRTIKVGDTVRYGQREAIVVRAEGRYYNAMADRAGWLVSVRPIDGSKGASVDERDLTRLNRSAGGAV